jgi:peptidyl-prolyl cis-trans isomerase C
MEQDVELSAREPMAAGQPSLLKRWLAPSLAIHVRGLLREPLVHFLLIGLALFAVYGALQKVPGKSDASYRIEFTQDDLRQLQMAFTAQWQHPPTSQELQGLLEAKVREEILYREALALGLDKDDTIVKRRMAQKMEFLSEDVAAAHEPTTQELKDWFAKNPQRFVLPGRATFRHLFFSFDRRGQKAQVDAARALKKLAGKPEDYPAASALADPFMLQDYYRDRTPEQVAKELGSNFGQSLFRLTPGSWRGPIESGYGWHLVWIDSLTPGREPAFEEIEPDVKSEWMAEQHAEYKHKAYEGMRKRYEIVLPQAPEKAAINSTPLRVAP